MDIDATLNLLLLMKSDIENFKIYSFCFPLFCYHDISGPNKLDMEIDFLTVCGQEIDCMGTAGTYYCFTR